MIPGPGLRRWLSQGFKMIRTDLWAWLGALFIVIIGTKLSLFWAGPALLSGLFGMALKRFDGMPLRATDSLAFRSFWSPWALVLPYYGLVAAWLLGSGLAFHGLDALAATYLPVNPLEVPLSSEAMAVVLAAWYLPLIFCGLFIQAALFHSWPLVAEGMRGWRAIDRSREEAAGHFWSLFRLCTLLTMLVCVTAFLALPFAVCVMVAAYRSRFGGDAPREPAREVRRARAPLGVGPAWGAGDAAIIQRCEDPSLSGARPQIEEATKSPTHIAECEYAVLLVPLEGGGYAVEVPALTGCVTEGRTLTEALLMAERAIKDHLQLLRKDDAPLPQQQDHVLVNLGAAQEAFVRKVTVAVRDKAQE